MPLLRLETTVPLSEEKRKGLLASLSKIMAETIGKPEQYVMVAVNPAAMLMAGRRAMRRLQTCAASGGERRREPGAFPEVCRLLNEALGVLEERDLPQFHRGRGRQLGLEGGHVRVTELDLPGAEGNYVLILFVPQMKRLAKSAAWGAYDIIPGFYAYVGSAFGPGGLRARIHHHLESVAQPHWHIDYLLALAEPVEVWYALSARKLEQDLAEVWNGLRVGACRFRALAPPTITAAAPAICSTPSAGLHLTGSDRRSTGPSASPLRFSNTVWRWTTLTIFRRAIFQKRIAPQAAKPCTPSPFAITALYRGSHRTWPRR